MGRRRLLGSEALGPVLVLLVLGLLSVALVATLPPPPEADLADHSGARGRTILLNITSGSPVFDHFRGPSSRRPRLPCVEQRLQRWTEDVPLSARPRIILPADAELMAQAAPGGRRAPDTSTDESCPRDYYRSSSQAYSEDEQGRCLTSHEHRLSHADEAGLTSSMRSHLMAPLPACLVCYSR